MKIKQLIGILESVLQDKGDVDVVILDSDSDAQIDVTLVEMTEDGRVSLYGSWSPEASYMKTVETLWERHEESGVRIVSVELVDKDEVIENQLFDGISAPGIAYRVVYDGQGRILSARPWKDEEE